jgi:hypothetical protein
MLSDDFLAGFRGGLSYATREASPVLGAYDSKVPLRGELDALLFKLRRRYRSPREAVRALGLDEKTPTGGDVEMGICTSRGAAGARDAGEPDGEAYSRLHQWVRDELNLGPDQLATLEKLIEECGIKGAVSRDAEEAFEKSDAYRAAKDAWRARRAKDQPPAAVLLSPGEARAAMDLQLSGLRSRLAEDAAATLSRAKEALARDSSSEGRAFANSLRRWPQARRFR